MTEMDPMTTHRHDQASAAVRNVFDELERRLVAMGGSSHAGLPEFAVRMMHRRLLSPTSRTCRHLFVEDPAEFARRLQSVPIVIHLNVPLVACMLCSDEALLIGPVLSRWRADRCDICDGIETNNKFSEVTARIGNVVFHGNRAFSCECRPMWEAAGIPSLLPGGE
jgi:hypothetical protein